MADTHTVMPKKLAQALMEAGMQHFDGGGLLGGLSNALGTSNQFKPEQVNNTGNLALQQGQQEDVYGQQQALASQLLNQTQGRGPGQQLINQQAGNNQAAMAATEAGVRGASANPALIARNAAIQAQQGNAQNLNAQAALQLQSQGALAQQQGQMANQSLQAQGIDQGALSSFNQIGAGIAGQNAQTNSGIVGGLIGGAAGALGKIFNQGGEVGPQKMASGGMAGMQNYGGAIPTYGGGGGASALQTGIAGGLTSLGGALSQAFGPTPQAPNPYEGSGFGADQMGQMSDRYAAYTQGGLPLATESQGGKIPFGQMLQGGNVPGKAQVKGNSKNNDTVPTMLSPGEIVIPRSITESKDAPQKAAEFIKHLKKRKGA